MAVGIDPWVIVGWVILGIIGFWIFVFGLGLLIGLTKLVRRKTALKYRNFKSRNIDPEEGQIWIQDNKDKLYIRRISENGSVSIDTRNPAGGVSYSGASWWDTPEQWKNRIRNRDLYLDERRWNDD